MKRTKVQADGQGVEINREVSQDRSREVIKRAISAPTEEDKIIEVRVLNEKTDFTQQVGEGRFLDVIEPIFTGSTRTDTPENKQPPALPPNFFSKLTDTQEALLTVLANDGEMLLDSEIRHRIREEHELPLKDNDTVIGEIISDFSRYFSKELRNNVFVTESTDEGIYSRKLADTYKDEITERLGTEDRE
jgi:hypothetical protein